MRTTIAAVFFITKSEMPLASLGGFYSLLPVVLQSTTGTLNDGAKAPY